LIAASAANYNQTLTPPIPADPLQFIRDSLAAGRILYHVSMRIRQRLLKGEMLVDGAATLEIIESYPTDKYLPSYLLRGASQSCVFHAQLGTDVAGNNVRVVTMYEPSPEEWDKELRVRRTQA
jgi:hypothetical protein